ncbi:MAG: Abi family protein [Actinomycetota bacterium]|nr:Abi family protein [Actinomycetota bacterium]
MYRKSGAFAMTHPDRATVAAWLSPYRYEPFYTAANRDHDSALRLYEWNAKISAAFLELFHYLEVLLRNQIDAQLAPLEVDPSARIRAAAGWWFASSTFVTKEALESVSRSRAQLGEPQSFNRDKMIANLPFGFWEGMFGSEYEDLWRQHLVRCFPYRQPGTTRTTISKPLEDLRKLRNRIAHHSPIYDYPLAHLVNQAIDIIAAIDPAARDWITNTTDIRGQLALRPIPPRPLAVIVPAREGWPLYQDQRAYICQAGRFFRDVSHIAFYADGEVKPEIPRIVIHRDNVPWDAAEIRRLIMTRDPRDKALAEVIKRARSAGWTDSTYQVFVLTKPGDSGHETLPGPIPNTRRGRGSGYVQRQRYSSLVELRAAHTTDDLTVAL